MNDTGLSGPAFDPARAVAEAVTAWQAGRIADAEAAAAAIVARLPSHAGALQLLGVIALNRGEPQRAVERLRHAAAADPHRAETHSNLGVALLALGRPQEAITEFEQAIELKPDYPEAFSNLGMTLQRLGTHDEAIAAYRRAVELKPDFAEAHFNLGSVLAERGETDDAITALRIAISVNPGLAAAHLRLGRALASRGDMDEAITAFRQALELRPNEAEGYSNLGAALWELHRIDEAVEAHRQAVALDGNSADAYSNFGVALGEQGKVDEAIAAFHRAITLKPDMAMAYSNLGEALRRDGRTNEAIAAFRQAIALQPNAAVAHSNLAGTFKELGKLDDAIAAYRRAIENEPESVFTHGGLAIALLYAGEYAEGWREYEWRWRTEQLQPRPFAQPAWSGEAAGEKVLLLHAEQGFGDTIQFCRYVPFAAVNANVVFEVPRQLLRLLSSLKGTQRIVALQEVLPDFNLHCPLLSLPRIFGTTLETIPRNVPYLAADATQIAAWRERLSGLPGRRIGLTWASNPDPAQDEAGLRDRRQKSMTLDHLAPLAEVTGVSFVSLQKGDAAAQVRRPPPGLVIHDWTDELEDFADTAALIEALDLVISVDTSVAHLAGALGKTVWLVNRFDSDWRWLQAREDSPWYPTMRIFRQPAAGDWDAVVARVAEELGGGDRPTKPSPRARQPKPATRRQAPAAVSTPRAPVIFNWGVASSFGWGMLGLHLSLNWAEDAALLPICASYVDRAGIAMDALRGRVLEPVLANAHTFGDWLANYRDQAVSVSCPVLHGLGNDLDVTRAAHNVELRGSPDLAMFFIEDTAIEAAARERAKRFTAMVAGSSWNQRLLATAGLGMPIELAFQGDRPHALPPGSEERSGSRTGS